MVITWFTRNNEGTFIWPLIACCACLALYSRYIGRPAL